jgi:hypothetical protein
MSENLKHGHKLTTKIIKSKQRLDWYGRNRIRTMARCTGLWHGTVILWLDERISRQWIIIICWTVWSLLRHFTFLHGRNIQKSQARGRRWDFAVEHECSHLAGSSLVNLGGVWFKNVREWNDSAPDSKNRMASLHVWKQEQSRSDFWLEECERSRNRIV